MNWSKLDVHLENLIPGLALLAIYDWRFGSPETTTPTNSIASVPWVGAAYLLGVVANLAGRAIFNTPSREYVRPHLLVAIAKGKLMDVLRAMGRKEAEKPAKADVNSAFSYAVHAARVSKNERIANEVEKRRQTGRLLRTAMFPGALAIFASLNGAWKWAIIPLLPIEYGVCLLLFAYAEVTIFDEAFHALELATASNEER